jgi:hypothetical protein
MTKITVLPIGLGQQNLTLYTVMTNPTELPIGPKQQNLTLYAVMTKSYP